MTIKRILKGIFRKKGSNCPVNRGDEEYGITETFGSLEQMIDFIEDPIIRIIANHNAGKDVANDLAAILADPKKHGLRNYDQEDYKKMLEAFESNGILIISGPVDRWINSMHPGYFDYGIREEIAKHASNDVIHNKGIDAYRYIVDKHEERQSDSFDTYLGTRDKIIASFRLNQEDTLASDRRAFSNHLYFSGELYDLGRANVEMIEANSKIANVLQKLGLSRDQAADIVRKYAADVIKGKHHPKFKYYNKKDEKEVPIKNAYGMLLEFKEKLGLTGAEEIKLAEMYKTTEYANMNLLEGYLPNEVAKWREEQKIEEECRKFGYYWKSSRDEVKQSEPFDSERFVKYDRKCFRDALKKGNLDFAYRIALERNYPESNLLAILTRS